MRRIAILLVAAGTLTACGHEPTAPGTPQPQGNDATALTSGGGPGMFGGRFLGIGGAGLGALRRLPANLALTTSQKQSIQGYVNAFADATKSDRQALAALFGQARDARKNGQTPDQVKAILEQGAVNRQHIQAAAAQLRQQVDGVLTADQKAWLAANTPKPCDRSTAPPLTNDQKEQIKSLMTAFRTANKTDLDAVRAAMQQAREARRNGAGKDQLKAILDGVKPNMDRLRTARQQLAANIQAVLTADQKASGCFGPRFGLGRTGAPGFRGRFMGPRNG